MHLFHGTNVLLVDFTGEYNEAASNLQLISSTDLERLFGDEECAIHADLHSLTEKEKVARACEIFERAAQIMRRRSAGRRVMILIDEAWKLIERNAGLEVIIREGRKYKVGLITSSQLLHDTSARLLSNMATIFIFKTTNARSLETMSRSFGLSDAELAGISCLERGSCFVIQLRRSGLRSAFTIRRIIGIRDTKAIAIRYGGGMEIGISVTEFEEMVAKLCGRERVASVRECVRGDYASLPELIARLIENGAQRRMILLSLQKLGLSNSSIADSFAIALNSGERR